MESPFESAREQLLTERATAAARVDAIDKVLAGLDKLDGRTPAKPARLRIERRNDDREEGEDPKKNAAYQYFVVEGLTAADTARKAKVSIGLVYKWSSKGKWKKARKAREKAANAADREED